MEISEMVIPKEEIYANLSQYIMSSKLVLRKQWIFLICIIAFFSCKSQPKVSGSSQNDKTSLPMKVSYIFQDSKDIHWFADPEGSIYSYDGRKLKQYSEKEGFPSGRILRAQEDSVGNIYFDMVGKVVKYDGNEFEEVEIEERRIDDLSTLPNRSNLWFCMGWYDDGPFVYSDGKLYLYPFPKNNEEENFRKLYPNASFNPYGIYTIYHDLEGNVWFGTSSMGLYRYNGKEMQWMYEQMLTETPSGGAFGIRSMTQDSSGHFWINIDKYKYKILEGFQNKKGISELKYQKLETHFTTSSSTNYFSSMARDKKGNIWLLTYDEGIYRYDGSRLDHYTIEEKGEGLMLRSIHIDNQGGIWVNTEDAGIYKLEGSNFAPFRL